MQLKIIYIAVMDRNELLQRMNDYGRVQGNPLFAEEFGVKINQFINFKQYEKTTSNY